MPYEPSEQAQGTAPSDSEASVLATLIAALGPLTPEARRRLLATLSTFFNIALSGPAAANQSTAVRFEESGRNPAGFTEDRTQTPKEFLFEKRPTTDVERAACLAYYLTHFRSQPHFKTLDISKLNTEAAQLKFSNPAAAVGNAVQAGLLVGVGRGQVQLSAVGEVYVQALPDRDAARAAVKHARPKRRSKKAI